MTEQAYLVLLSLADERRHGYGIVGAVLELSGGGTRLGAGTLYGLLDRMQHAGLVRDDGTEVVDGRLRRYYCLTEPGAAALAAETDRLQTLARRAQQVLRHRPALGSA